MAKVVQYVDEMTGEKESVDSMIRRFKKLVIKDNLMDDIRKHEYYKSKSQKRREKRKEAERRAFFESQK